MNRRTAAPVLLVALALPMLPTLTAPASAADACSSRTVNPRKAIAPKTFAKCTVAAMKKSKTVVIRTTQSGGPTGKGPYRFGKTTDASVSSSDGSKQVALGKNFWMKPAGEGWSKGKKNGNADEQLAHFTGVLWRANASAASYKRALGSSTVKWKWTGVEKKINGVKAREYAGKPVFEGVKVSAYTVWLDTQYRPIRVASTVTGFGVTVKSKQDFTKWGKKVTIKAPKVK
ncbi:hypothetical protein [Nocardioides yefusunii]|uniref:Uncharacterized protein n=1 Tax=Nocardioides yefusunii TaxID=2500546 RepID=A0ABW1QTZ8_9ACTN|nr:hypothetical protein [Nocardioides yefusunii]